MIIITDMDGVVAKYDRKHYVPDENGISLLEREGVHLFLNMAPDYAIIGALRIFETEYGIPVYVMSKIPPGKLRDEHYEDKVSWCHQYLPFLDVNRIMITSESKTDTFRKTFQRDLILTDYLIDDYNENLSLWSRQGGTSVKYLNAKNTKSTFEGPNLNFLMSSEEMVMRLLQIHTVTDDFHKRGQISC